jgi:hypothetical protein
MTQPPRSDKTVNDGGISLFDSITQVGQKYVELKAMGVDKENIMDVIRLPFMYATSPNAKGIAAIAPEEQN